MVLEQMSQLETMRTRLIGFAAVIFIGYFLFVLVSSPDLSDTAAALLPSTTVDVENNISYAPNLSGDFYRPRHQSSSLDKSANIKPLIAHGDSIVLVHGGSWTKGDRNDISEVGTARFLAELGFIVFVIDYRMGAEGQFPHDVQDVQHALKFLQERQKQDDVGDIFVGGSSSGATAAMLAAYMPEDLIGLRKGEKVNVKGVLSFSGPSDLAKLSGNNPYLKNYIQAYAANHKSKTLAESCLEASPITYAATAVPTLLIHGTSDHNVPFAQSKELCNALLRAKVPAILIAIEGGEHFIGMRSRKLSLQQGLPFLLESASIEK